MIFLDCIFSEAKPLNLTSAEAIVALSRVTLFCGTQKLIVNDVDFTSEVPLFWAGHELREIVYRLKTMKAEQCEFRPMNGSPEITFSMKDGQVIIAGLVASYGIGWEQRTSSVSLAELEQAVKRYSRKIYKKLSKLYLPLREDYFRDWFYGEDLKAVQEP